MTDPTPTDDELLSSYVDGEASADEIARIERDPALHARAEQLGAARELASTPVVPLAAGDVDRIVEAALEAAGPAEPTVPLIGAADDTVADLDAARRRRAGRLRRVAAVAAAAVLIALAVPLIGTLDLGGGDNDDVALDVGADADEVEDAQGDDSIVTSDAPAADDGSGDDRGSGLDLPGTPEAAEAAPVDEAGDAADDPAAIEATTTFDRRPGFDPFAGLDPVADPDELAEVLRVRLGELEPPDENDAAVLSEPRRAIEELVCTDELTSADGGGVPVAVALVGVGDGFSEAVIFQLVDGSLMLVVAPLETCGPVVQVDL